MLKNYNPIHDHERYVKQILTSNPNEPEKLKNLARFGDLPEGDIDLLVKDHKVALERRDYLKVDCHICKTREKFLKLNILVDADGRYYFCGNECARRVLGDRYTYAASSYEKRRKEELLSNFFEENWEVNCKEAIQYMNQLITVFGEVKNKHIFLKSNCFKDIKKTIKRNNGILIHKKRRLNELYDNDKKPKVSSESNDNQPKYIEETKRFSLDGVESLTVPSVCKLKLDLIEIKNLYEELKGAAYDSENNLFSSLHKLISKCKRNCKQLDNFISNSKKFYHADNFSTLKSWLELEFPEYYVSTHGHVTKIQVYNQATQSIDFREIKDPPKMSLWIRL